MLPTIDCTAALATGGWLGTGSAVTVVVAVPVAPSSSVTVTAKVGDRTLFLIEVEQGGLFRIANVLPEMLPQILGITCPNLLYPYAREVVSDASVRAGFMPIVLQPINFEGLYQQQQAGQAGATDADASH